MMRGENTRMSRGKPEAPRAWQRMLSGRRLDLVDPSPLDIEIGDIAHGLARVARWNGQTLGDNAFSVAQHSCLVLAIFEARIDDATAQSRLMALLHDAPEYVVGDMISPFKAVLGGQYRELEQRLLSAVHVRFGLPAAAPRPTKAAIKKADRVAAYLEAVLLAGFSEAEASRLFGGPPDAEIEEALLAPLAPADAQALFLDAFERLRQLSAMDGHAAAGG